LAFATSRDAAADFALTSTSLIALSKAAICSMAAFA